MKNEKKNFCYDTNEWIDSVLLYAVCGVSWMNSVMLMLAVILYR